MTAIDVQMGSAEHFEAPVTDEQLQERFSAERLSGLCKEFIVEGPHGDLREKLDGRPFIVATVAGTDTRFRDIAKSTETIEFAKRFKRSWSQVYNDYKDTDPNSTFLVAIDNSDPDAPRPIGVVRMIEGNTVDALKDMKVS